MSRSDEIVALIDAGLQSSTEHGYGSDNGRCVRCQLVDPAPGSSWCVTCRAFLLAEEGLSPERLDAILEGWQTFVEQWERIAAIFADAMGDFVAAVIHVAEAFAPKPSRNPRLDVPPRAYNGIPESGIRIPDLHARRLPPLPTQRPLGLPRGRR